MAKPVSPDFKEQLQHTLKFFSFKPSLYVSSPRISSTNKFMLFIILAMVETFFHLVWYGAILIIGSPNDIFHYALQVNQVFNRPLVIDLTYLALAVMLFYAFSIWVINLIPEKSNLWLIYQGIYILVYLIYEISFTIWIGDNSALEGVILISATGMGMVLLRWGFVWLSFITAVVALFVFNVSVNMDWWQLVPRLYPEPSARTHWLWGLSYSFLVATKATVTLYCILQVIKVISFQRRKIHDLLEVDALTNIANRRTIYSFLSYLWEHKQNWSTLSVIYLDLDKFKCINDEHGHDAGDATLVCTANILKQIALPNSLFGRIGGEEFCIVLPNVDIEQATQLAEQLRQTFASQIVKYGIDGADIQFTASLGVASIYQIHANNEIKNIDTNGFTEYMRYYMHSMTIMPALPPELECVMKFADVAMQQAKVNGRNQVIKGQSYQLMP